VSKNQTQGLASQRTEKTFYQIDN